jgi:hypothetical protein
MTTSPRVLIKTLDPYPIEICVEINRKRSVGRRQLMHHPSSNTRSTRRPNILNNSDENIERSHHDVRLPHAPDEIVHESNPLNNNQQ